MKRFTVCRGCTERSPFCHTACLAYLTEREMYIAEKRERDRDKPYYLYQHERRRRLPTKQDAKNKE